MDIEFSNETLNIIGSYRLPRYQEIPNVGLYLEQTAKYINEYFSPLFDIPITGSMISNYVKKHLVDNPIRKQYYRDQIAYLIFIGAAKSVLSMDNIQLLLSIQKQLCENQRAYDYFCGEFENILQYIFGLKENADTISSNNADEKLLLRNIIMTVVHKIYLDKCFRIIAIENNQQDC